MTGFAGDTLVRDALDRACRRRRRRAALDGDDHEADPGRGRPRRRQLRRGDGAPARERDAGAAAAGGRPARPRGHARRGRPVLPRRRAAARPRRRLRRSSRSSCRRTTGSCSCSRTAPPRPRPRPSTPRFDERDGAHGWDERRAALETALAAVRRPRDLAALPPNDLASSPLAADLRRLGAFRADVSGAGPTVYGLFHHRRQAEAARRALRNAARPG